MNNCNDFFLGSKRNFTRPGKDKSDFQWFTLDNPAIQNYKKLLFTSRWFSFSGPSPDFFLPSRKSFPIPFVHPTPSHPIRLNHLFQKSYSSSVVLVVGPSLYWSHYVAGRCPVTISQRRLWELWDLGVDLLYHLYLVLSPGHGTQEIVIKWRCWNSLGLFNSFLLFSGLTPGRPKIASSYHCGFHLWNLLCNLACSCLKPFHYRSWFSFQLAS